MRASPQGRRARVVATKKKKASGSRLGRGCQGQGEGEGQGHKAGLARPTITGCSGGGESVAEKEAGREMEWGESTW